MSANNTNNDSSSDQVASTTEKVVGNTEKVENVNVDTVHADEAMKILANYTGDENWEEAEENKLRRKIDWRLMPILCITYMLQYYDKAMLSQAVCIHLSMSYG